MSGKIADLVLTNPASAELHDFQREGPAFARRRFTFEQDVRHCEHLPNIVTQPVATASAITRILSARYLCRPRRPGFLLPNASGRYALHYYAEQRPDAGSRIALSGTSNIGRMRRRASPR